MDSKDIFENVVDNDAGEDILLQKLAEESELAQQEQNQQGDEQENEEEGSSSRKYHKQTVNNETYLFDQENGITICFDVFFLKKNFKHNSTCLKTLQKKFLIPDFESAK